MDTLERRLQRLEEGNAGARSLRRAYVKSLMGSFLTNVKIDSIFDNRITGKSYTLLLNSWLCRSDVDSSYRPMPHLDFYNAFSVARFIEFIERLDG